MHNWPNNFLNYVLFKQISIFVLGHRWTVFVDTARKLILKYVTCHAGGGGQWS